MSPERINPEGFGSKDGRPTKPSDCYALGMVIYETISGNIPFHKHADLAVFVKVLGGERPPRGAGFTESLWEMLELCWMPQPNDRPSIEAVLQCLEVTPSPTEHPSPRMDEGKDEGDDGWDSATSSSGGDSLDSLTTDDHEQLPPIHSPQDHHLANDLPGQRLPINPALTQGLWVDGNGVLRPDLNDLNFNLEELLPPGYDLGLNFERDFGQWFDPGVDVASDTA